MMMIEIRIVVQETLHCVSIFDGVGDDAWIILLSLLFLNEPYFILGLYIILLK